MDSADSGSTIRRRPNLWDHKLDVGDYDGQGNDDILLVDFYGRGNTG